MIRRFRKHFMKRGQVGQSIVILALGMVALLGFVGITTDVSLLFVRYSTLRRAIDSAAIAAAGQIREGGEGEASDVVARASLAARQFIEFHGINPTDVAVELCENQPRRDFDPSKEGLQTEPSGVTQARGALDEALDTLKKIEPSDTAAVAAQRDTVQVRQEAYTYELELMLANEGITPSADTTAAETKFENARSVWNLDKSDPNWDALQQETNDYIAWLERDADLQEEDDQICTPDQRKLVRVTAQVESPTVFLRLFGWDNIMLQASAISETAVLDVVLVMDVSESMLADTTYNDWATVNLGTAYIPPQLWSSRLWKPADDQLTTRHSDSSTVVGQLMAAGFLPAMQSQTPCVDGGNCQLVSSVLLGGEYWDGVGLEAKPPETVEWVDAGNTAMNPGGINILPNAGTWLEWFWLDNILGEWQATVNNRLNFINGLGANVDGKTVETLPIPRLLQSDATNPSVFYEVRSFVPNGISGTQGHPRSACRVRFYPYSFTLDMTTDWPAYNNSNIAQLYDIDGGLNDADWFNIENADNPTDPQPRWSGFVPTYNFYGCCNDPTSNLHVSDGYGEESAGMDNGDFVFYDVDGNEVKLALNQLPSQTWAANSFNVYPDFDFSDLICQPFKEAKDATRAFLRRVDFLRGDRVAFVTYDRSAFLIDPDGSGTVENHMIETYDRAVEVLNRNIGVRAEPNFYVWADTGGWTGYAAGFDQTTGESQPVNYDYLADVGDPITPPSDQLDSLTDAQLANLNNYPVYNGCYIQNALMVYPYTLYASRSHVGTVDIRIQPTDRGTGDASNYLKSDPALLRRMENPPYFDTEWRLYVADNTDSIDATNLTNDWVSGTADGSLNTALYDRTDDSYDPVRVFQSTYERHGICRGGNVGAALRQASSALNDPRTSRRDGAVWIIIVLGDGASGGTDPVRQNGSKLGQLAPYDAIEVFDYTTIFSPTWTMTPTDNVALGTPADNDQNLFGGNSSAGYGAYGLCPYGVVDDSPEGVQLNRVGELVRGDPNQFPWCLDKDPYERHFCVSEPGISVGYSDEDRDEMIKSAASDNNTSFGPGFSPNAQDRDWRFNISDADPALPYDYYAPGNERKVAPIPLDYQFSRTQWLLEENARLGNIFDVDLGDWKEPTSLCDPLYDPDDYARDWADYVAGVNEEDGSNAQLPTIFTIGFGLDFEKGDRSCEANIEDCLGEELLRYIADAGDNFEIDNDVQQDLLDNYDEWRINPNSNYPTLDGSVTDWGPKDPCEPDFYGDGSPTFRYPTQSELDLVTRTAGESCGNYYNAPSLVELQAVFDDIASRMFTRLTG